jgi:hypothetical protein
MISPDKDTGHRGDDVRGQQEPYRIIGIVLVKNEDVFIEDVLVNILQFCDKIIVTDNCSTDNTGAIIRHLASRYEKIEYHQIDDIATSHELIRSYAGKRVWIFGVDGDEIYDPARLTAFREDILAGRFNGWWMIFGNVLNCTRIDSSRSVAHGHLSPPCRSMTKLYNFGVIEEWPCSSGERLHGGEVTFKEGFDKSLRLALHENNSWDEAMFRCLHMCFLKRSSKQKKRKGAYLPRPNPADIMSRNIFQKMATLFRRLCGLPEIGKEEWKIEKFTRGEVVEKDVSCFFTTGIRE